MRFKDSIDFQELTRKWHTADEKIHAVASWCDWKEDSSFYVAVKDNISVAGTLMQAGSHILEGYRPVYDAAVISQLRKHGASVFCKSKMDELGMGDTGLNTGGTPILNPYDLSRITGGSSGGSAALVANGCCPLAIGTDTGDSIRQPASFCGLVGLKPTYGRVSRYGLIAFASSLDQIGPMTTNVMDNAILLGAISGKDDNDLTSSDSEVTDFTHLIGEDVKDMRIAVPNYYMSDVINSEVRNKVKDIINLLEKNGCAVDYVDVPYLEYAIPLYQTIALGEASSNLARFDGIKFGHITDEFSNIEELYKKSRSEGFGAEVKRRIMIGSYVLSGENANIYFRKALKLRKEMTDALVKVFDNYDLIIGPTNTNVAYDFGLKTDDALKCFYDDLLTIPVNMAGLPGLSMPIGFNSEKLPIGMHIIGNYFKEDVIYKLASFIEKELDLDMNPKGGKIC